MTPRFSSELNYASKAFSRMRQDIFHADVAGLSSSVAERDRWASVRAFVYVGLAATLERIVRDAIGDLLDELTMVAQPPTKLRPCLFALLCDAELQAVSQKKRNSSWETRLALFEKITGNLPAAFPHEASPLDGKTLRGEHFDTIWSVFGFPSPSLPSPQHRTALIDLADGRNDVAHGEIDPVTFGRLKATSDLIRLTARVEEIVAHLLVTMDDYASNSGYLNGRRGRPTRR
jgi:hypothetical protein